MANELMKQESSPVMSLQREHDQFEFDYRLSKALSASNMTGIFKTPEQVFTLQSNMDVDMDGHRCSRSGTFILCTAMST